MPTPDPCVLFGLLALHNRLITREVLHSALATGQPNATHPLARILVEQHALGADEAAALEELVRLHIRRHGDIRRAIEAAFLADPTARPLFNDVLLSETPATRAPSDGQGQPSAAQGTVVPDTVSPDEPPGAGASAISGGPSRYRILRAHARGGLGEVFVALDGELNREVALKEIQTQHADNVDSRARFLLEALVTGRLEHPGVVPVYGLGVYGDGRPYYAMRFIKGHSLKEAIAHFHASAALDGPGRPGLELRQLLGRFVAMCNAVAYAHSEGVLHRDLKPANVMLGNYGETLVVDWGLAKTVVSGQWSVASDEKSGDSSLATGHWPLTTVEGLTQPGDVLGTPAYMSPEQADGQAQGLGVASDVYSLGATLYHLLAGKPPFDDAAPRRMLERVRRGQFPPPRQLVPTVPAALEAVCLKAMARRPEDRYPTATALAADLERWLADEPVAAYAEPLRLRLTRWRRRHPALVTGAAALLFTVLVAVGIGALLLSEERGRTLKARDSRALAQVNALLDANSQAVPAILEGLEPYRSQLRPRLQEERGRPEPSNATVAERRAWERHWTRAALALLPDDPDQLTFLKARLLDRDVEPEEMLLIRDLLPVRAELTEELWAEVRRRAPKDEGRFRALVALARFDPQNPRWAKAGREVVAPLLASEALHVGVWSRGLRGVRKALLAPLGKAFRGPSPQARRAAASVLRDYASNQPRELVGLLVDADAQQFPLVLQALRGYGQQAVRLLNAELDRLSAEHGEVARDRLGQQRANGAVALLRLGGQERAWPLLRQSAYPDARTYLLHRAGPLEVDVAVLLRQLAIEKDASIRQALILALGEYASEQVPGDLRTEWTGRLLRWYRDDPDPGIHAAIDWLLGQGMDGPQPRKLDWGQAAALRKIDNDLASRGRQPADPDKRRWYVNGQGQTMVLLEPATFWMGAPDDEKGRPPQPGHEQRHERRIGRHFALASKKVTVAQYRHFLKDHPAWAYPYKRNLSPDDNGPMISVTWEAATQYCNWLSEQEGIPANQWCYPSFDELTKRKQQGKPLTPPHYLARTGYRLPSEAEWEYACRVGALTSRYYGSSEEMLDRYAWHVLNAHERTWPVGQKKPNAFGLFDMHGNTWDWCSEGYTLYPTGSKGQSVEDEEDNRSLKGLVRVLRGGSFFYRPSTVRCASRLNVPATTPPNSSFGLRVARTTD